MRRSAAVLIVGLSCTVLVGCNGFGKKKSDASADMYGTQGDYKDPYAAYPATGQAAGAQDTYATTASSTAASRYHVVQKKETLYSISRQYYGDQKRWREIYDANRAEIGDPNKIKVGQKLVVP